LTLLLPERSRLAGRMSEAPTLARVLARGDVETVTAGSDAQLLRHFDVLPRGLPVAALTRQLDCGDAEHSVWLRADPAQVRADLGSGRLMACGGFGLTREEAESLVRPLRILFGDEGCPISVGAPERWYLMLPRESRLPAFVPPEQVLGDDIYPHLPDGDLGRRWRRLLNEAQILLHNHPVNVARLEAGKPAVNSLWFWGAGALPDHVRTHQREVLSDEAVLRALCARAGVTARPRPAKLDAATATGRLVDLRDLRELGQIERDWIAPAVAGLGRGVSLLRIDGADGFGCVYRASHRWRFWRRAPA
jgi:hypothetical protein